MGELTKETHIYIPDNKQVTWNYLDSDWRVYWPSIQYKVVYLEDSPSVNLIKYTTTDNERPYFIAGFFPEIKEEIKLASAIDNRIQDGEGVIILPKNITSIGDSQFGGCENLETITIPEGILSIEKGAFSHSQNLTTVILPQSTTYIGDFAFNSCPKIINVFLPDGITSINDSLFEGCSSLNKITLPKGIQTICEQAFYRCSNLTEIILQEGITYIGKEAFKECKNLKEIILPEGITYIGKEAFKECKNLKEIILPEGIKHIDDNAFYDTGIEVKITLPASIEHLGIKPLPVNVHNVYCKAITPPQLDGSVGKVYRAWVPRGSKTAYENSDWGAKFGITIIEYDF